MTFFLMHSGEEIDLSNFSASNVNLHDIAHHLTKTCRYSGCLQLEDHYSVAQHSMALSQYACDCGMPVEVQRGLLMHDASEAYLGDVNGVVKKYLPDYLALEDEVTKIIEDKYQIVNSSATKEIIKELDKRILLDEARTFINSKYHRFKHQSFGLEPLGIHLKAETNLSIIKNRFLVWCSSLNIFD